MPPRVYVETTVISYLTARDSRDAIRLAHQAITRRWWADRRPAFDVFVSELVVQEAGAGDAEAARERLAAIREVPVLAVGTDARALAKHLVERRAVPAKAAADAAHIAAAACNGIDFLLTWNCTHIANAETRRDIENACEEQGYKSPVLCTPEELMGGENRAD